MLRRQKTYLGHLRANKRIGTILSSMILRSPVTSRLRLQIESRRQSTICTYTFRLRLSNRACPKWISDISQWTVTWHIV